jgi:hypothetical protein
LWNLNGAGGAVDTTRVCVTNDGDRSCCTDACRVWLYNPEFLLTTEDWAQPASKAAPSAAASSRTTLRIEAADVETASS